MSELITTNRVLIVSDLHFGGSDRQIFAGAIELPALLRDAAKASAQSGRTAFVINGDFIDFLAEAPATYFDALGAVEKLRRVARDATFADSFVAMGEFANTPGCVLAINLGNHDLELCLPEVQAAFCELIGSNNVLWVSDGSGVSLRVGACEVLCLHGNEVDINNVVDFDVLRDIKRAHKTGKPKERLNPKWIPNAGTQLVIDAMNAIKRDHAFIDVLKPEDQAAVRVLLALDFEGATQLVKPALNAMFGRRTIDQMKRHFGLLSESDEVGGVIPQYGDAKDWLSEIDADFKRGVRADSESLDRDQLKWTDDVRFVWDKWRGKDGTESLRLALEGLSKDRSFDVFTAEKLNEDLIGEVDIGIAFLCSGHTHFARSLRRGPNAHHYNSGTWAYLMQIGDDIRLDPAKFDALVAALRSKPSLAELETLGYLKKELTVIDIEKIDAQQTRGQLRRVKIENNTYRFDTIPGTDVVLRGA